MYQYNRATVPHSAKRSESHGHTCTMLVSRDAKYLTGFIYLLDFKVSLLLALCAKCQYAIDTPKIEAQGQGDENSDAVRQRGS